MLVLWSAFDARVIVIFVAYLSVAEIFVHVRRRLSMACPHCGFDPVIYLRDPREAARRVKLTLEERQERPEFLLSSKNPLKNLPRRPRPDKNVSGGLVSKQV